MKKIKKRKWTHNTAVSWILKVNSGKEKYGLQYVSACHFLKISPAAAMKFGK